MIIGPFSAGTMGCVRFSVCQEGRSSTRERRIRSSPLALPRSPLSRSLLDLEPGKG